MAIAELSENAKLLSDAKRELAGLKHKKAEVTRNLNKCLTLLDACKNETPLSKTSAEDTITQYNRAQVFPNNLEVSVEKYLTLLTQTYREEDYPPVAGAEGGTVDGLQVLIDKNIESLCYYTITSLSRLEVKTLRFSE